MKSIAWAAALFMCCGWTAHGQVVETNHVIKRRAAEPAPLVNISFQATLTNGLLFSAAINEDRPQVRMVITNQPLSVQTPHGNGNGLRRIAVTNQSGNMLLFALPPKRATNAAALGSASPPLKPGNYQAEPYRMIVKVPEKHPDETMASSAPEIASSSEAPMPVIKPELRFVPRK